MRCTGSTCGCGNGVMAFDLQRPLDGTAPPRSILEAHYRTALGPAADQPETSGHHGDPRMVQILQVKAHETVLAPHKPRPTKSSACRHTVAGICRVSTTGSPRLGRWISLPSRPGQPRSPRQASCAGQDRAAIGRRGRPAQCPSAGNSSRSVVRSPLTRSSHRASPRRYQSR